MQDVGKVSVYVCIYMCVCMCVCVYICVCVYMCVYGSGYYDTYHTYTLLLLLLPLQIHYFSTRPLHVVNHVI